MRGFRNDDRLTVLDTSVSLDYERPMPSPLAALAATLFFQVHIEAWTRVCKPAGAGRALDCALPAALKTPFDLEVLVEQAPAPGQIRVSKLPFGSGDLSGEIRFYSTYPTLESGLPPYIQIQVESFSPVRSLCLQSVRLRKPFEASPLTCTGFDGGSSTQIGFNLKIEETSK